MAAMLPRLHKLVLPSVVLGPLLVPRPQLAGFSARLADASRPLPSTPATPQVIQCSLVALRVASGALPMLAQPGLRSAIKTLPSRWDRSLLPTLRVPEVPESSTPAQVSKLLSVSTFIMALAF